MNNQKTEGQYMSPPGIVDMTLDGVGYTGKNILSSKIIEPSFGDGAFLSKIVQRILSEGKEAGLSMQEISDVIKISVFGIEKDEELYSSALNKLKCLMEENGLPCIDWTSNLLCGDALSLYRQFEGRMDFVVGNPPYIRIHNIPRSQRNEIKYFQFTKGMADLYVIFFEIGISMLNAVGKLGYISPNSFLKNTSQRDFRNFLAENEYISAIYDFKNSKIFENADTYTCICILDKNRKESSVEYREYSMYQKVTENHIPYHYFSEQLKDRPWCLHSDIDMAFLEANRSRPVKVSDIAVVQNGIATNKDEVYIIRVFEDISLDAPYMGKVSGNKKTVYFKDKSGMIWPIESTILHRCVKASKYSGMMDNTYIIFPYMKAQKLECFTENDKNVAERYKPMAEDELAQNYPDTYRYLSSFRSELENRNMDKNAAWFLFGRSQGLQNIGKKKIVFKHIIAKDCPAVKPYMLDEDVAVYSGIYITARTDVSSKIRTAEEAKESGNAVFDKTIYDRYLSELYDIFGSCDFARYCTLVGKDQAGGYISISAKMVKQYGFSDSGNSSYARTIRNI